jgi:molybdenum cofactor cytidylyltransferase
LAPVAGLDAVGQIINNAYMHRPERVRQVLGLPAEATSHRLTPAMMARLLVDKAGGAKGRPSGARLIPLLNKAEVAPRLAVARLVARQLTELGYPAIISAAGIAQMEPALERWAPAGAVVLAAGQSSRMGQAKQLLVVDGETLVNRAVRVALQSAVQRVIVVTGAYADEVCMALAPMQKVAGDRIQLVHNPEWLSGQAASMQAGLIALPEQFQVALFLPVDQPFLQPLLLRQLARLWRQGARLAAPVVNGQIRGAPAIFDRSLWPELLAIAGDRGGRAVLQKYHAEAATVAAPAQWLYDVDSPEQLSYLPFISHT